MSIFDLKKATFEDLMLEHWHPSIKIIDIVERSEIFLRKNVSPVYEVPGKLLKFVNAKSMSQTLKFIIASKFLIGIVIAITS